MQRLMVQSEVFGDALSVLGLVKAGLPEREGEAFQRASAFLCRHRTHCRGVESPGEEVRHGELSFHPVHHRDLKGSPHRVSERCLRAAVGLLARERRAPPPSLLNALGRGLKQASRLQFVDVLVDGLRCSDVLGEKELGERRGVEAAFDLGMRQNTGELACKEQGAIGKQGPVERLLAEAIAHKGEASQLLVVDGQGEHAMKTLECSSGLFDEKTSHHLGVGGGLELSPSCFELFSKRTVVVDLTVEGDCVATGGICYGFCPPSTSTMASRFAPRWPSLRVIVRLSSGPRERRVSNILPEGTLGRSALKVKGSQSRTPLLSHVSSASDSKRFFLECHSACES